MSSYPDVILGGKEKNVHFVENKDMYLKSIVTVSTTPYGIPEEEVNLDSLSDNLKLSMEMSVSDYAEKENINMEMTYSQLPSMFSMDLSSTLLTAPQQMKDEDCRDFVKRDKTYLQEDIREVPLTLNCAKNSTSFNRRFSKTGIRGNEHNQPLLPGGLTLMDEMKIDDDDNESDDDLASFIAPESLALLQYNLTSEENKALTSYANHQIIQPSLSTSIPDLVIEGLTAETEQYEFDYFNGSEQKQEQPILPSTIEVDTSYADFFKTHTTSSSYLSQTNSISIESIEDDMENGINKEQSTSSLSESLSISQVNSNSSELSLLNHSTSSTSIKNMTNSEFINKTNELLSVVVNQDDSFVTDVKNRKNQPQFKKMFGIIDDSDMTNFYQYVPHMAQVFPFELDDFQKRAIVHLERGESVYVCAHTSAGKTVVADYAISLCQAHMTKCIYTSPVKALSNQKYHDFKQKYEDVGIITGDISVNPTASTLIMTTEILRELLYNGSDVIRDVEWVIFDEAHYINNADRGVVWEESIILLPDYINMAFLSATTPNVLDIADWIGRTKHKPVYIMSTLYRPVPLEYNIIYEDKVTCIKDTKNKFYPERIRLLHHHGPNETSKDNEPVVPAKVLVPSKKELGTMAKIMKKRDDMPCIIFALGRSICNDSAYSLAQTTSFLNSTESAYVRSFYDQCISNLRKEDQNLRQVTEMRDLVTKGIAVHHAGLLPLLKETVEMLFSAGYIKFVFATETFAIGINMPAKAVCFLGMAKFDGVGRRFFLSSEFTQMAGRAGRRGKDDQGDVFILVKDLPNPRNIMDMVDTSKDQIQSRFKISYSMILNIIRVQNISLEGVLGHSFLEAVRMRELDQMQFDKKIKDIDECLYRYQSMLIQLLGTTDIETIITDYETTVKRHVDTWKSVLHSYAENTKKKEQPLLKGRYIVAKIPFILDSDVVKQEETVCAVMTIKDDKMIVFAHTPFVSDIPEKLTIFFTPRVDLNSMIGKYVKLNNEIFFVTVIDYSNLKLITNKKASILQSKTLFNSISLNALILSISQEINNYYDSIVKMNDYSLRYGSNTYMEDDMDFCKDIKDEEIVLNILSTILKLREKKNEMKQAMTTEKLGLLPELHSRIAVLTNLNYIDDDSLMTLKGRCCCYIRSGHELLLLEMVFDNLLEPLSPPELAAVASVMIYKRQNEEICPIKNRCLLDLIEKMETIVEHITEVEKACGMDVDEAEAIQAVHHDFMEVAYNWCKGLTFRELMKTCPDLDEGYVVTELLRTEAVCRKLGEIATEIGNPSLRYKCEEISKAMLRDIVFTPSLYLSS